MCTVFKCGATILCAALFWMLAAAYAERNTAHRHALALGGLPVYTTPQSYTTAYPAPKPESPVEAMARSCGLEAGLFLGVTTDRTDHFVRCMERETAKHVYHERLRARFQ